MVLLILFHRNLTPSSPLTSLLPKRNPAFRGSQGSLRCVHGFRAVCAWVPCDVCMGSVRYVHGFRAVCAWVPCDVFTGPVQCVHGFRAMCARFQCGLWMGSVRCVYGFRAVCAWVPCGMCTGSMLYVHEFRTVCAWVPCGVCMGSVRYVHGFRAACARVSCCVHGFRAVCAWVSCGVCTGSVRKIRWRENFFRLRPQTATFKWLQLACCSSVCCANQCETSKRVWTGCYRKQGRRSVRHSDVTQTGRHSVIHNTYLWYWALHGQIVLTNKTLLFYLIFKTPLVSLCILQVQKSSWLNKFGNLFAIWKNLATLSFVTPAVLYEIYLGRPNVCWPQI